MKEAAYSTVGALFLILGTYHSAGAANLLFSDGFESGNTSAWVESHGAIVSNAAAHSGLYGLEYCYGCYGGGGNTLVHFPNTKRVYLSFYRKFVSGFDFTWVGGRHMYRLKSNLGGGLDTEVGQDQNTIMFSQCTAGTCVNEVDFNGVDTNFVGG